MKRKLISLLLAAMLCLGMAAPAFAVDEVTLIWDNSHVLLDSSVNELDYLRHSYALLTGTPFEAEEAESTDFVPVERENPLIVDEVDVLTDEEDASYNSIAERISAQYQSEVAVVFISDPGEKSAMEYADDYYDYNGYGYGDNDDGILLLVAVDSRDYWITTHGTAISVFTDSRLDSVTNAFLPCLSDNDWSGAAQEFLESVEYYLELGPYTDSADAAPSGPLSPFALVVFLPIGFLLAGIPLYSMKKQLNSVASTSRAAQYAVDVSITKSTDHFLRQVETRRRIDTDNSSSGGGSSTHTSSSGRSHGGSGGSF